MRFKYMHSKLVKSKGKLNVQRYSELNKVFLWIISLLLFIMISLVGCSYTVPQNTKVPRNTGVPQKIEVTQDTKAPHATEIPQYTFQKPSQETLVETLITPRLILNVDSIALLKDNLNLNLQTKVSNPNPFDIEIDKLKVSTGGIAGTYNLLDTVPGGSVKSASVKEFKFSVVLPNLLFERIQVIRINTQVVNADKTIPVSASTEINIPEVMAKLIINPKITAKANINRISWNGMDAQLEAQVEGNIDNPNPLSLRYDIIRILVKDKKGQAIAADNIPGDSIAANSNYPFRGSLVLPIRVMNETGFTTDIVATVQIPHYALTIKYNSLLAVPKLRELISVPQINLDTDATWVTTSPTPIIKMTILTLINNDNKFPLTTGDLKVNIYKPVHALVGSTIMSYQVIQGIGINSTATLTNWINIRPDIVKRVAVDVTITAETNVGVEGIKEKIPLNASMVYTLLPQSKRY